MKAAIKGKKASAIKPKKAKKSPEQIKHEREAAAHAKIIREIFDKAGFTHLGALSGKEFTFEHATCDFDDVFLYQNILVICENTVHSEAHVSDHLKRKKIVFDKISSNPSGFIAFLRGKFPNIAATLGSAFSDALFRIRIVYCSKNALSEEVKTLVPDVIYLDYPIARYFQNVARTVKLSVKYELLEFLQIRHSEAGMNIYAGEAEFSKHKGSILPESFSNYGKGFKVVSFYVQPSVLLERCYVLRRGGWRQGNSVYQRMISRPKIDAVRKYLAADRRAFINNIIVTLPPETQLLSSTGTTVDPASIQITQSTTIQLPKMYNSIGIIDGQHRVFSYYEGGPQEDKISPLRSRLNLLVTGVIYPTDITDDDRARFEATLFLEINSNQTNAKSDLRQEINVMLKPFLADSVSRLVVNALNDRAGALNNEFERYFYDLHKLKTTSVASFGIKPLVSLTAEFPLFNVWENDKKGGLASESDVSLLYEYVDFCRAEINKLFSVIKQILPKEKWTADRSVDERFLTTTNVNGVLLLLRKMAREGKLATRDSYLSTFASIGTFKFSSYKSSQYNSMAEDLYKKFF